MKNILSAFIVLACTLIVTTSCEDYVIGGFHEFENIIAYVEPLDLDLYRELLPEQLMMPEHPEVAISVIYYKDVMLPLTPYYEAFILLRAKDPETLQEGIFTLTMPVTKKMAMYSGISIGFPKYIADVTLEPTAECDLVGELIHDSKSKIKLQFSGFGVDLLDVLGKDKWDIENHEEYESLMTPYLKRPEQDFDLFAGLLYQLLPAYYVYPPEKATPPDAQARMIKVSFTADPHEKYDREVGAVRLSIDKNDPWGGLIPSDVEVFGIRTNWKGSADLWPVVDSPLAD